MKTDDQKEEEPSDNLHKFQFRTVLMIEIGFIIGGYIIARTFWEVVCNDTVMNCIKDSDFSIFMFLFGSLVRPFVLTPTPVMDMMCGNWAGSFWGTLLATLSATISTFILFTIAKAVGTKMAAPWLKRNLPETYTFIRSQDWKVILAVRLIPIIPFDFATLIFGLLNFRFRWVLIFTFLGHLPEASIFAKMGDHEATFMGSTLVTLGVVCFCFLLPGLLIEFFSRKKGGGMWMRAMAMYHEIQGEVKYNNTILKRQSHDPNKIPVLLLYGFFSSRRSLTSLERILTNRGYEVLSFNLGGLFGVFFTRSITETAKFIDEKLKRHFKRKGMDEIYVVGHSKGGLVALWWLLKFGGHNYCKKVITIGTPFKGTKLTWLLLATPVGWLFKDMWQMRPGSLFLKEIHEAEIPEDVTIYNIYSYRDKVATGKGGILQHSVKNKRVLHIPMHHITHFEFLFRREVGDTLARLLGSPFKKL